VHGEASGLHSCSRHAFQRLRAVWSRAFIALPWGGWEGTDQHGQQTRNLKRKDRKDRKGLEWRVWRLPTVTASGWDGRGSVG